MPSPDPYPHSISDNATEKASKQISEPDTEEVYMILEITANTDICCRHLAIQTFLSWYFCYAICF